MAKIKSKIEEEAEGCFTSMIDIVFLLLIYFVVQPFKAPELRMLSYLPKDTGVGSGAPSEPKTSIRLEIAKGDKSTEGRFTINSNSFTNGDMISSRLLQEAGGDETVPVILAPTGNVAFKFVLKALDQCSFANMKDVTFAAP